MGHAATVLALNRGRDGSQICYTYTKQISKISRGPDGWLASALVEIRDGLVPADRVQASTCSLASGASIA